MVLGNHQNYFLQNLKNFCVLFRLIRLLEEIMSEKENKTIIFVETKRRCDDLTRRMRRDGYVLQFYTKSEHNSSVLILP